MDNEDFFYILEEAKPGQKFVVNDCITNYFILYRHIYVVFVHTNQAFKTYDWHLMYWMFLCSILDLTSLKLYLYIVVQSIENFYVPGNTKTGLRKIILLPALSTIEDWRPKNIFYKIFLKATYILRFYLQNWFWCFKDILLFSPLLGHEPQ